MRLPAILTIFAATLLVGGCSYEEQVTVFGPPERPTVAIKPAHQGLFSTRAVGVEHLTVSDLTQLRAQQGSQSDANSPVEDSSARWRTSLAWNIAQSASCHGPTRIEYGSLPPGFRELPEPGRARALVEGHIYAVTVRGCGLSGRGVFRISKGQLTFAKREEDLR